MRSKSQGRKLQAACPVSTPSVFVGGLCVETDGTTTFLFADVFATAAFDTRWLG